MNFNTSMEATGIAADSRGAVGLGRLRLEALGRPLPGFLADAAYDNRLSLNNQANPAFAGALPSTAPVPFRIWQLGGVTAQGGQILDYHELDRVFLGLQTDRLNLEIGRQAVGWGRGVLFSAVDLFAPFTPLEIDRQWRRGVDALAADFKLTQTTSLNLVSAWGPSWDQSAQGLRLRGYLGQVDAEMLLAKRAQDFMYGLTSSMAWGGVEIHAEGTLFKTPGDLPDSGMPGNPDLIPKGVLGISNNFDIGTGLKATLEYHYSGFAAPDASRLPAWLSNPAYLNRYLRGDTQILLRQAGALAMNYSLTESWSSSLELLQSLVDPSGLVAPSASWDFSESFSFAATAFLGWGAGLQNSLPQSQFGATPLTVLIQAKFYD
jgi:hypothetical protein